ncbi:MAG TPA: heat-shock protein [Desulfofustis sp.]|jgi:HSP20 family protein|nr:Hsp20/alpha crystallin family protein [Desulfofustis sp. PB-SRB1]HBH29198.1 heat-shock protein [Desulfofustis sp.]HBH31718.1 heat-shock protein [Desulfofustis sp.]
MEANKMIQADGGTAETAANMQSVIPLVDIYENNDEILLHVELPGVTKEAITVNIDNGTLVLTGTRTKGSDGIKGWREFGDVRFQRSFSVPQAIDVAQVRAELKDGILHLHLPKSEAAKPRIIEIKSD